MKKRLFASIMALLTLLTAGCFNPYNDDIDTDSAADSGQYVQEYLSLPGKEQSIKSMKKLNDGTVRVIGETGIYDSKDHGRTWNEIDYGSPLLTEILLTPYARQEEPLYDVEISCLTMDVDGKIFFSYSKRDHINIDDYDIDEARFRIDPYESELPPNEYNSVIIHPDGREQPVNINAENFYQDASFTKDGHILVISDMEIGQFDLFDTTGTLLQTIEAGLISEHIAYKDQLIVSTGSGLDTYELDSGKLASNMAGLDSIFSGKKPDNIFFIPDEANDTLYVYTYEEGIYEAKETAAAAELILDGSRYALSNAEFMFRDILVLDESSFLASYEKMDGDKGLLYYTYSNEPIGEAYEFTVYSLKADDTVKQKVDDFQESHPQYIVHYQYGIGGNEIPVADAIKNLNTDILAGTGPDVIVMDDIPIDSYLEKGALADISDIISDSDTAFFENIVNTYSTGDALYAIPTRFHTQAALGIPEHLNQISDLSSLAAFTKEMRSNDTKNSLKYIIGDYWFDDLASLMLQISGNAILKEDNTLDEKILKEFLSSTKTIHEYNLTSYELDFEPGEEEFSGYSHFSYFMDNDITEQGVAFNKKDENLLLTGNLQGMDALAAIFSLKDDLGYSYKLLDGLDENVYMPFDIFAVNGKSDKTGEAKKFISYMLSNEMQTKDSALGGFPVSADAYSETYTEILNYPKETTADDENSRPENMNYTYEFAEEQYENIMIPLNYGTKEDYEEFGKLFSSLDTPSVRNSVIVDVILGQTQLFLDGETTLDETVDNIIKIANLHLAE